MNEYPSLKSFVQTYFHQDWGLDYSTSIDVIKDFIKEEPFDKIEDLHVELCEILGTEEVTDTLIYELGGNYKPAVEGINIKEWFEKIILMLQEKINENYSK